MANAHEALSNPAKYPRYLDWDVQDWIQRCGPGISQYLHKPPFTDAYPKGLDALLSEPTQQTIETARNVLGILDNQGYRQRVIESLKDFSFADPTYVVNALREMNALDEGVVNDLIGKAKERLGGDNSSLYVGTIGVLKALGVNLADVAEIRHAEEVFYRVFQTSDQPYDLIWSMRGVGIEPDVNRMLLIAKKRLIDDELPYAAARMAKSMKMLNYDIGTDMSWLAEIAVRRSRSRLNPTGLRNKPVSRKDRESVEKLKEKIRKELAG